MRINRNSVLTNLCVFMALCFFVPFAYAESINISSMTVDELLILHAQIRDELLTREDYLGELVWPTSDIPNIIPVPDSSTGSIAFDTENGFAVTVGQYH